MLRRRFTARGRTTADTGVTTFRIGFSSAARTGPVLVKIIDNEYMGVTSILSGLLQMWIMRRKRSVIVLDHFRIVRWPKHHRIDDAGERRLCEGKGSGRHPHRMPEPAWRPVRKTGW